MTVVPFAAPARPRAARALGVAVALGLPVAAAALLTDRVAIAPVMAAACGAALLGAGMVWTARRHGLLGLWLALLLLSILAGEMSALPLGGQSGRLLWADAVLAVGLAVALARGRFTLAVPRAPFLDALAALAAWGALSLLVAHDPLTGIAELKEWVVALAVGAAALSFARDDRRARLLLGLVVVTGVLVALHMAFVAFTARTGPALTVLLKLVDLPWGRTNYLAGLLILALPVALGLLGSSGRWTARALWATAAVAIAAGIVLSASKGAVVALVVGLGIAFAGGGRAARASALVLLALAGVAVALFAVGPLHQVVAYRLQASALDYSMGQRMDLYRLALVQFARHPLTGVGLNNFSVVSNRLTGVDTVPHNFELGFLAELGAPGLALAVWLGVALLAASWRARATASDPRARALAVGLWAAFLGCAVHNQFESTLYGQQFKMLLVATAAATWHFARAAHASGGRCVLGVHTEAMRRFARRRRDGGRNAMPVAGRTT